MAFAISTSSSSSSSLVHPSTSYNSISLKPSSSSLYVAFSNPQISTPKNGISVKCISQLGLNHFSQWSGLKLVGSTISQYQVKIVLRKGKCKNKGGAYASLFGVGAPEVLVIGVVALLVFGPKGLAEAARGLGKAIRAFQPTIRELQEVSREFKSTLEREIGLDDADSPASKRSTSDTAKPKPEGSEANVGPNGSPSETKEDSIDDDVKERADLLRQALLKLQEEDREREEKKKAEREQAEAQVNSKNENPSQDTTEASQASHNLEEASSNVNTPEIFESNPVQEVVTTTGHAVKSITES